VKLTIGGRDATQVLSAMTLEKSRSEAAATLTATLWQAAADAYLPKLSAATGDAVRLTDDSGGACFLGAVQTVERTAQTVAITACDRGVYLARNELNGVFAGTGAQIAAQVASRLGVTLGGVDAQSGYRLITARAGHSAFAILREAVGEDREIFMDGAVLRIAKTVGAAVPLTTGRVLDVSCRSSVGRMVNRCAVMKSNGAQAAFAQNKTDIDKYGQYQSVQILQGVIASADAQAAAGLRGKTFTADVTVMGSLALRCGGAVTADLPDWGLRGTFAITAVRHRWREGVFTTELTLEA
jgi:uncharacterized metal-binding protein